MLIFQKDERITMVVILAKLNYEITIVVLVAIIPIATRQ